MATIAEFINVGLQYIIGYATDNLMPFMLLVFLGGAALRAIIYFTIHCEATFALEFEKRVHKYLADPGYEHRFKSFHALTRRLLERTYEEHYELKKKLRRRRMDQLTTITDRLFMIPEGARRLISDTLSQTKYLHKGGKEPKFLDIARWVFESNPVFNRVLGILPMAIFHDILNILPGLFVIGGIFGTFLGVMQALPMLSEMDITNVESTKAIMDSFLLKMAFSMGTSVVGIILSVSMTMLNALLNPDGTYYSMVNKYTSALDFLWNDTSTNEIAESDKDAIAGDRRAVAYSSGRVENENSDMPSSEPLPLSAAGSREQELESLPTERELRVLKTEDSAVAEVPDDEDIREIIQEFAPPAPVEPKVEVTLPDSDSEAGAEKTSRHPSTHWDDEASGTDEVTNAQEFEAPRNEERFSNDDGDPHPHPSVETEADVKTAIWDAPEAVAGESSEESFGGVVDEEISRSSEGLWDAEPEKESRAVAPEQDELPVSRDADPSDDPTGLQDVFSKVDEVLAGIEAVESEEIPSEQEVEARIEVLRHRLRVLDEYLQKADADRLIGKMSEEMWKEETERYATEKEQIQQQIEDLENTGEDKAA